MPRVVDKVPIKGAVLAWMALRFLRVVEEERSTRRETRAGLGVKQLSQLRKGIPGHGDVKRMICFDFPSIL